MGGDVSTYGRYRDPNASMRLGGRTEWKGGKKVDACGDAIESVLVLTFVYRSNLLNSCTHFMRS